jgi:hypothetical protein
VDRISHGGMLVFGHDGGGNLRPVWIAGRRNGWEAEHVPEHLADDFVLRLGGATVRWASPIESGSPYGGCLHRILGPGLIVFGREVIACNGS